MGHINFNWVGLKWDSENICCINNKLLEFSVLKDNWTVDWWNLTVMDFTKYQNKQSTSVVRFLINDLRTVTALRGCLPFSEFLNYLILPKSRRHWWTVPYAFSSSYWQKISIPKNWVNKLLYFGMCLLHFRVMFAKRLAYAWWNNRLGLFFHPSDNVH